MKSRVNILFQNTIFRYLFGIAAVASVFALRIWLIPFTGTAAPFVLFFAAVLVTSLFAGVGPAICALLISMPLGAYTFVVGAGYSIVQASFQSLLFAVDGTVVIYLTFLTKKAARSLQNANRQVRESEGKYRALFDSIDEGFCVVEILFDDMNNALDYRILEVNRAFEKQSGIANAAGRWIREIVPANEEYWFQIYGQIALSGESRRFENPTRALGRLFDVYAFRVGRPEQRQVAILFNDITKRKQVEEALQRTQALNKAVLDSVAANIAVLDREGNIIAVNEAWKRFAYENNGAAVADSVGVNYLQACSDAPESRDGGWAALNGIQAVLDGTDHNFILEYPCHSPSEKRWFLMSVTPLLGERGGAVVTHADITKRKQSEEELKAANAFLDAIIENIPLMLFIKESQSLRFIRLNRTAEDLLGWPKETLKGKNAYDFWPKEQAEFFIEKDRETLNRGSVVDIPEEPILTRYRGVRILHTKKVPILDTTGHPIYLLGISEDITERKRFEKEQQFLADVGVALSSSLEYEQTLVTLARLVVQNIADWCAVDVMDEEGQLMRLKVASADPDQTALCTVLEQMPLDRDLPHLMRSVIESKRPVVVEQVTLQYIESLGQGPGHLQALLTTGVRSFIAVPLLMRGQALGALFLGSSTLSRVIGQGDLRLAEALADRAAMAIENARLYRASVRATQLQQVLSEAGAVLASSLDYEQTLATVAHLVVRDFADWCLLEVIDEREQIRRRKVVAGDPSKADVCAFLERIRIDRDRPHLLRGVFDTKQSLLIEHVTSEHIDESAAQGPEHLHALRAVNPTSLMAAPLLRHGQLLGILAFVSSTESRRYGPSDLRLAQALADRAAVAIENARLYRDSVLATQLRDQVLGVVAHDLRNPLSTILMQASVAKRHGTEPERRSQKPMEVIERAARRMNRLIQDLLDVALMEVGQLTIERAQLSTVGLIVEAVDMQRPLASSSSLEIRVEVDPAVAEVWGDRDRLLQVFENLIGNAIKFTQAGGRITAGATSRDDGVVFWVADTGCGIPSENLPRVFDRFWQATRTGRQGAGLGLPITKGIVEAHGGRIWVESTAGSGSTFFFTIPRASAAQDGLSDRRRPDRAA